MEAVIIKTRTKSDVKFLMNFAKRIGVQATFINTEDVIDSQLVSLIEQGLVSETVDRDEVMKALGR
ncbi:MAG: hypothetical protein LBS80_04045 [Tannerella sp.]|jgi:hypothetical protein|nr:hypothetical protein [Tannerella sp.]